ncbi:MAG: GNAT family N-acetyltransferase [Planctomycetota bacterium]|jgi:GNAT superfamily N-acetyltransferase
MNIRKAENQLDYKTIAELADLIWHEHYSSVISKEQIDYMIEKFQSEKAVAEQIADGAEYFIFDEEERAIGYLAIEYKEDTLFLSKIYLLKEMRGKGYGRQAIEFIEDKAEQHNLNSITLTVNKENSSVKAYKRIGFEILAPVVKDIGGGFVMDDYLMRKSF